jgi:hypothetical protein
LIGISSTSSCDEDSVREELADTLLCDGKV